MSTFQKLMLATVFTGLAAVVIFALSVNSKLERMVASVERTEQLTNKVVMEFGTEGAQALRRIVHAMDSAALGAEATNGVREVGRVAKERALDLLNRSASKGASKSDRLGAKEGTK